MAGKWNVKFGKKTWLRSAVESLAMKRIQSVWSRSHSVRCPRRSSTINGSTNPSNCGAFSTTKRRQWSNAQEMVNVATRFWRRCTQELTRAREIFMESLLTVGVFRTNTGTVVCTGHPKLKSKRWRGFSFTTKEKTRIIKLRQALWPQTILVRSESTLLSCYRRQTLRIRISRARSTWNACPSAWATR